MCVRNSQAFYPVACVVRACLTRARAFCNSSACGAFHPVARGHVSYLYVRSSWGRFTLSPWARAQRIQNRKLSLTICVGRQPREPTGGPRHPRRQGRRHPCRVAEEEAKPLLCLEFEESPTLLSRREVRCRVRGPPRRPSSPRPSRSRSRTRAPYRQGERKQFSGAGLATRRMRQSGRIP